jgi:aminoglycoside phosphotransferase (APT) family kinase protein
MEDHATPVDDPTGIDVAAVTAWLGDQVPSLVAPFTWAKLPGGHSNLTYRCADATGRRFVVRRPPLGELLPSAHDMGREYRVISALWPTAVPVPEPLAHCTDVSVTGAPFYVMGEVVGRSLYVRADVEALVPEHLRRNLGFSFIDVLASLHAIEPASVGLERLGKPDDYVLRQLNRWNASWVASQTEARPSVDALYQFLVANIPPQGPARIVHGDYGLHNCISAAEGHIAAVVDWEISTLGDPLADVAYALNSWVDPGDPVSPGTDPVTLAPGFPTRAELAARYGERTGVDVSQLDYYTAFNSWKSIAIVDGVLARYLKGQKSAEGVDLAAMKRRIDAMVDVTVARAAVLGFSA